MIAVAVLLVLVVWFVLRRRRANTLAGRNSLRPTYMVEPPSRRVGTRKREAL